MRIEDLRQQLNQKFDLICFVDLSEVRGKHRLIFDLFKKAKQDRFHPSQRLVLYTSHEPEQSFLDHVQRAAARIDISNYFILIVCPYDITEKLRRSNKKFGYDDSVIQSLVQKIGSTAPFAPAGFASIDALCPLPFSQALVLSDSSVRPCCKFQKPIGTLNESTLEQIFVSKEIKNVRAQMLAGNRVQACDVCWQNESRGTTSFRQLALEKYGDLLDEGWLDDPQLRDVTWGPATLCNFKCRICHPSLSTSIAAEEIKFSTDSLRRQNLKNEIKQANAPEKNLALIDSLVRLTNLGYLHILGGEPFLWPQLSYLIDQLIDQDLASRLTIEFNSNGSLFPKDHLERIIANFQFVEILLSIDNVGERFEIERGGNWPDVMLNLRKFASLRCPKTRIKLACTVNLQNVLYLDDIVQLSKLLDIEILWWYLETPDFLCIDRATRATKQLIISRYEKHNEPELRKIASRMDLSQESDGQEFLDYMKLIDRRRAQHFHHTHAEIYESMGGCF